MPVYDYRCSAGHQYEKIEGFDAPTVQACLQCGEPARRLISVPAVIFKGSGFYSTDNRKNSSRDGGSISEEKSPEKTAASTNGDGHSHGGSGDSHAKTEAKADAKSEAKAAD